MSQEGLQLELIQGSVRPFRFLFNKTIWIGSLDILLFWILLTKLDDGELIDVGYYPGTQ